MKEPMEINEEFMHMFINNPINTSYYKKELLVDNDITDKSTGKFTYTSIPNDSVPQWLTTKEISNIRRVLDIVSKLKKN
jgi:hypothetical protein